MLISEASDVDCVAVMELIGCVMPTDTQDWGVWAADSLLLVVRMQAPETSNVSDMPASAFK